MKKCFVRFASVLGAGVLLALGACTSSAVTTALSTPAGALFCSIQTSGGGTILATLVNTEVTAVAGAGAGAATVLATGATKTYVDNACAQAAANVGAVSGVPVSPPASTATVSTVAVTASKITS